MKNNDPLGLSCATKRTSGILVSEPATKQETMLKAKARHSGALGKTLPTVGVGLQHSGSGRVLVNPLSRRDAQGSKRVPQLAPQTH